MNLKTIAQMAGVSAVTVSNVINGNHHKVSKQTIERVQKIIEETNYQPSATARSLVLKKSNIIGVVIPNLAKEEPFSVSPYNTQILGYLERAIRNRGYYLMFRCVGRHTEVLPLFSTWNVDGALLMGAFADEVSELEKRLKTPAVYIDAYAQGIEIANVGINDYKGGYLSAGYLLDRGHRNIAFAGPAVDFPGVMQERYRGFCDAFWERGVELPAQHCFQAETLYESGVETGKRIVASGRGYTAVCAMSDILSFGILKGLEECGLRVPEDISIIGFDDLPECRYSHPQLTSISQNLEQKAELACEYLFSLMEQGERQTGNRIVDVKLVERQSVRSLV